MAAVETQDLENIALQFAQRLEQQTGHNFSEQFLQFQSLIRSILGDRLNESFREVVDTVYPVNVQNFNNPDAARLQNLLSQTIENF